jgi:hypothetical protein
LIELIINNNYSVSASQNFGPLKTFRQKETEQWASLFPNDRMVVLQLRNGQTRKQELYWGSGFLSQSPGMVSLNASILSAEVTNSKGEKRKLK